jgi:ribose transport system substrate-binding protein
MRPVHLVSLLAALGLAACRARASRPTVGVALAATAPAFAAELERGMRQVHDSLGLALRVVRGDAARQAAQVDSLVARRVRAIILEPADPAGGGGAAAAIARAQRAGVPVFTVETPVADAPVVSHIGSDARGAGELLAWYLARRLEGGGNIALLDQPALPRARAFAAGFRLVLTRFPNVRIVASPAVHSGTRAEAERRTATLLAADQSVNAVAAPDAEVALGALAAIRAAGRTDVVVAGYGMTPEFRAAIARGTPVVAAALPQPVTIGRYAVEVAASHLRGNRVMPLVPVPVRLVDRDSLGAAR